LLLEENKFQSSFIVRQAGASRRGRWRDSAGSCWLALLGESGLWVWVGISARSPYYHQHLAWIYDPSIGGYFGH